MWISPKIADRQPAAPPEPRGTIIGRFPRRGPGAVEQELRVSLEEYHGSPYLSLRVWSRGQDGVFYPVKGKGVSIRCGECEGVASALRRALEMVGRRDGRGPDRRRDDRRPLRYDASLPPTADRRPRQRAPVGGPVMASTTVVTAIP